MKEKKKNRRLSLGTQTKKRKPFYLDLIQTKPRYFNGISFVLGLNKKLGENVCFGPLFIPITRTPSIQLPEQNACHQSSIIPFFPTVMKSQGNHNP